MAILLLGSGLYGSGFAGPVQAGKLDLDIFGPKTPRPARRVDYPLARPREWRPGDPRDLRGEPPKIRVLSHAGYASLGAAGLIGSVATGGVLPAVGFGIVAAYHGWSLARIWWSAEKKPV